MKEIKTFKEREEELVKIGKEKGYIVKSASVRFVVAWKPKDAPKEDAENAILLADLTLMRQVENNGIIC